MELHHVTVSQDILVTEICVPILMSARRTLIIVMQMLPVLIAMVHLPVPVTLDILGTVHTVLTLMNALYNHTTVLSMQPVLIMTAHSRVLVMSVTQEMEQFA